MWLSENEKIIKLREYIDFFQDTITKDMNWIPPSNLAEANIVKWFKSNNKSYFSEKYLLTNRKREIFESIKWEKYYIFKKIVEEIWRELVQKLFEEKVAKLKDNNISIETLITSESDDVSWGVDLIVIYNENWKESYLWIDIAVSNSSKYLEEKNEKRSVARCIEFNLNKWLPIETVIKRVVVAFEKEVLANFLLEFFESIKEIWIIDIMAMYRKHYEENHNSWKERGSLTLASFDSTKGRVSRILAIND